LFQVERFGGFKVGKEAIKLRLSCLMRKNNTQPSTYQCDDLPVIAYILAFLIGLLFFLIFGESMLGIKPDPAWVALLMGLSVSAIVFWAWGEIHDQDKDDNND
jgi:hypothetical protein